MGPSCGYHSFGTIGRAPFEKGAAAPLLPFRRTTGPLKRTIAFLFTIWPPLSLSLFLSLFLVGRVRFPKIRSTEIVGQRFRDRFNTSFSIFLFSPPGFFLSLGRTVNFTSVTFYDRAKPTVKLITRIRRVLYGIERTSGTIKRNRLVFSMNGPRGIEKSLDLPGLITPRNRVRGCILPISCYVMEAWSPLTNGYNRPGESVFSMIDMRPLKFYP